MAIQRYLATRNAASARGVLLTALVSNVVICALLAAVGLALLAYYKTHSDLLATHQNLNADADKLFPNFIKVGLPAGITGLVVAGLLAAAMSSLSSGVSSVCSVITVDFIDRFWPRRDADEFRHVRVARIVSVAVGLVAIGLAIGVGMIEGNLLEVSFKVVNLLTAPLFGLFFMAMFVPWATGRGTLVGAAAGLIVVFLINYWKELTGTEGISFIWAMPIAFVVQATVGSLASLHKRRREPLS
jgi:SSS family solute:Na+ symporter